MQGNRRDIVDSEWTTCQVWDYGKISNDNGWHWYFCIPSTNPMNKCVFLHLFEANVAEHEDKTVTMLPSVIATLRYGDWYLERGVWREV